LRRFAEEHLLYEAGMLYEVTGKLMNRHHQDDLVVKMRCSRVSESTPGT
jgi:hypothetical protein